MSKLIPMVVVTALALTSSQACRPRERIVGTLQDTPENVMGESFVGESPQAGSKQATEELADFDTARALSTILYDRTLDDRLQAVDGNIAALRAAASVPRPGEETSYADVLSDLEARRAQIQDDIAQMRAYGGVTEEALKQNLERKLQSLEQDATAAADALRPANS